MFDNADSADEVAEHEAADEGRGLRDEQDRKQKHDNGKRDLLDFAHRTELFHTDEAFLFRGERPHDGRLDEGHEGHVRIRRDCHGCQEMRGEFGRDIDRCRAVRAADDGHRAGFFKVEGNAGDVVGKAHEEHRAENAELGGRAQDSRLGVCDKRAKVRHRADADEDD